MWYAPNECKLPRCLGLQLQPFFSCLCLHQFSVMSKMQCHSYSWLPTYGIMRGKMHCHSFIQSRVTMTCFKMLCNFVSNIFCDKSYMYFSTSRYLQNNFYQTITQAQWLQKQSCKLTISFRSAVRPSIFFIRARITFLVSLCSGDSSFTCSVGSGADRQPTEQKTSIAAKYINLHGATITILFLPLPSLMRQNMEWAVSRALQLFICCLMTNAAFVWLAGMDTTQP